MNRSKRSVGIWLLIGVLGIYIQVVIGGITRLTGSGLSITKWEILPGTIPPLNEAQWEEEFERYQATSQYQKINKGMSLQAFKGIYFWEYVHRLWARLLGFIFLIPFIYFIAKKYLAGRLLRETLVLFFLGGLVGLFGWLMVKTGLGDRPSVSPYNLALHLSLALIAMTYAFWLTLKVLIPETVGSIKSLNRHAKWLTALVGLQIILGAIVSGTKSALLFPTWPDMNGAFLPIGGDINIGTAHIQFSHRWLGMIIVVWGVLVTLLLWKKAKGVKLKTALYLLPWMLALQLILGIITLVQSKLHIPVTPAVIHQGVAILILLNLEFLWFASRKAPL